MAVIGIRRAVPWFRIDRRTLLGVALAAAAALAVLLVTSPTPTVPVLVAASGLPQGTPLSEASVTVRQVASSEGLIEGTGLGELDGWTLAAPVAEGEPLIPSLLRSPAQTADPHVLALAVPHAHAVLGRIGPGDLIDIFVTWPGGIDGPGETELLAGNVYVVEAVTDDRSLSAQGDVSLLLAVDQELGLKVAGAAHRGDLDILRVGP